ncbi:DUF2141 domain-containing protein [Schlegelella sp. S2-27]|uniref:DUF2141 domain-containing protein n=1 Tax=Caldimonas mangrovi TaxID=2944811 RepID=A0ABT0YRA2_9BURK|nr:DUF2141 domain-containing protein [Caldimonas mangrovi]MCM5681270.1 DUF2141 domain-containing protein [Caldimonas mangrovi]
MPQRLIAACLLAGILEAIPGSAAALDLAIEVTNPKLTSGTLYTALYNSADGWMSTAQAMRTQKVGVQTDRTVVHYRDLPPGRYALSIYHDENDNGRLDTNVLGIPRERTGFSSNVRGRMGPPSFEDAAVKLEQDTTLTVNLH